MELQTRVRVGRGKASRVEFRRHPCWGYQTRELRNWRSRRQSSAPAAIVQPFRRPWVDGVWCVPLPSKVITALRQAGLPGAPAVHILEATHHIPHLTQVPLCWC